MKRRGSFLHIFHLLLSVGVTGGIIYMAAFGAGPLPPLAPALNPGMGIWTTASDARQKSETLHFEGLQRPVTVILEADGTSHIQAATDGDLFWAIGYVQAHFRLTQMDLMRRQGEGQLSAILGPEALDTDRFQLMLGLTRAAQADWQAMPASSLIRKALQDYANGVNAFINKDEQSNALPFMFKLLNYQPQVWTPIDTLVIQEELTQELDFTTAPLDYALMVKALGYQRTMDWFPVLPTDIQHPYDIGPYNLHADLTPLSSQLTLSQGAMQSITALEQQIQALPGVKEDGSASNNWAVNGSKAPDHKALMAGDPHLHLSIPSTWYQFDASSPDYSFSGVAIPGIPMVLMGRNQHISWSMTDVQNGSTLFYAEKTDSKHPNQYYWNGAWRQMQHIVYTIPVKGATPVRQDVYLTVHGPIFPADQGIKGETIAVDWISVLPSTDGEALLGVLKATNYNQFRDALSKWSAPTLNFVYADDQGNIGMIAPGYYPIVKSGAPWLPLPGSGDADIVGSIPYNAIPQVYDPPNHMVFSANQRPVNNNYPYYIGTTWNNFDNGYRADEIAIELSSKQNLTVQDMEQMQSSVHDYLAGLIVPELLKILQKSSLKGSEQDAKELLQNWNENMDVNSSAAALWWTFWTRYLIDTFGPWWQAYHVPVSQNSALAVKPGQTSLDEDLETWTLHDPTNTAFTLPNGTTRDANAVMFQAFQESVKELSKSLGDNLSQWQWGKLHSRQIGSLLGPDALGYGPRASGGDQWTLNSVAGDPIGANNPTLSPSEHGPSWRMIIDWSTGQTEGVYPGGQDENPTSPWYENEIATWWNGQYYPMINSSTARKQVGNIVWTLSA